MRPARAPLLALHPSHNVSETAALIALLPARRCGSPCPPPKGYPNSSAVLSPGQLSSLGALVPPKGRMRSTCSRTRSRILRDPGLRQLPPITQLMAPRELSIAVHSARCFARVSTARPRQGSAINALSGRP